MDSRTKKIVAGLEEERDALIRKFLEFTDLAESYGDKAYEVSCRIECINLALREARDTGIVDPELLPACEGRNFCHVPKRPTEDEEREAGGESELAEE